MRKTDKQKDNNIRRTLTDLCESELELYEGFEWLTHHADFSNFPNSLKVVVVFDTELQLQQTDVSTIKTSVVNRLAKLNIKLNKPNQHILFDTQEMCNKQHQGNWAKRITTKR